MLKKQILILCIICCTHLSSCQLMDILKLGRRLWKLKGVIDKAQGAADTFGSIVDIFVGEEGDSMGEVLDKLDEISTKLDDMQESINKHFTIVEKLLVDMPGVISQDSQKLLYRIDVDAIDHAHTILLNHLGSKAKKPTIWAQFAREEGNLVRTSIVHVGSALTSKKPLGGKGLIELIGDIGHGSADTMCKEPQTVAYYLMELLKSVILTEMKALQVLTATFKVQHPEEEVWQAEVETHVGFFEKRYLTYITTVVNAMNKNPSFLTACDPPRWIRDETYFQFRGYQSWYASLRKKEWGMFSDCNSVNQCRSHEPHGICYMGNEITTCKPGFHYMWAQVDDTKYGANKSVDCKTVNGELKVYGSGWFAKACLCSCKEALWLRESYVSLRESLADVDENMVITGAKIVLNTLNLQRILYIQVKAGKLLPGGEIDPDSNDWVDLPTGPQSNETLSEWPKKYTLNNPVLPFGYVAVGVRFVEGDSDVGVYIEVIGKRFDYDAGELLPGALLYAGKSHELSEYKPLKITNRSSIYGENLTHVRNSGKYTVDLRFHDSDDDMPYLPVPLFDGVPVVTKPPSPLGGIGLYHKHADGFAGFISVQLNSLPYKEFLMDKLKNYKPGTVLEECSTNSCTPDNIFDLGEKLYTFMHEVIEADEDFLQNNSNMKDKFNEITKKLNGAESNLKIEDFIALIANAIKISQLQNLPSLQTDKQKGLQKKVRAIDKKYTQMHKKVTKKQALNYGTGYSVETVNEAIGYLQTFLILHGAIHHLQTFFVLPKNKSFIQAISNHYRFPSEDECQSSQTMQHILTQIFQKIMVTDMKATLVLIVYLKLTSSQEASTEAISEIRDDFKTRFINYVESFSETMKKVPGEIRACDDKRAAIVQESYFKVEAVQHTVVVNHRQTRHTNDVCNNAVESTGNTTMPKGHKCDQPIALDCQAAEQIAVCRGENPWIISLKPENEESGDRDCTKIIQYPSTNYNEKQCICSCGKPKNFISLALVMANVTDNMVVTGVRFLNQNGIFHIQLKQGKLSPNGGIQSDSENGWIRVQENPKNVITINAGRNKFFLDDIIFPSSYAVVGLQFVENDGFFLRVTAQKFDFPKGMLLKQNRILIAQHDDHKKLQFKRNNSIDANVQHRPSPKNHWIELTTSGEGVLPLFDAVAVEADPPTVMGGIGIFHNGASGYAGYIALRLHSLQFQKNLEYFLVRHKGGHAFMGP